MSEFWFLAFGIGVPAVVAGIAIAVVILEYAIRYAIGRGLGW